MKAIVKTAVPIATSAATAWIVKRTRLPAAATPIVSLVVGAAAAKLVQRLG